MILDSCSKDQTKIMTFLRKNLNKIMDFIWINRIRITAFLRSLAYDIKKVILHISYTTAILIKSKSSIINVHARKIIR